MLQYRAYKQVADFVARTLAEQQRRLPRDVELEPRFAALLPEVVLDVTPERFAALAAKALTPAPAEVISLAHLHAPVVSVRDSRAASSTALRRARACTFRTLTADSPTGVTTVAPVLGPAGAVQGRRRRL